MRESRQGLREKHESHESEYVFSQSVRLGLLASNIYEHAQDAFRGIFGVLACRAVSGFPNARAPVIWAKTQAISSP